MSQEEFAKIFKRVNDFIGMSYYLVQNDKKELVHCQTRDGTQHVVYKFARQIDAILQLGAPIIAYADRSAGDLHAELVANGFQPYKEDSLLDPVVFSAFHLDQNVD